MPPRSERQCVACRHGRLPVCSASLLPMTTRRRSAITGQRARRIRVECFVGNVANAITEVPVCKLAEARFLRRPQHHLSLGCTNLTSFHRHAFDRSGREFAGSSRARAARQPGKLTSHAAPQAALRLRPHVRLPRSPSHRQLRAHMCICFQARACLEAATGNTFQAKPVQRTVLQLVFFPFGLRAA